MPVATDSINTRLEAVASACFAREIHKAVGPAMSAIMLAYRCRRCGQSVTRKHDSPSPTLAYAMEAVVMLVKLPGAGVIDTHECAPGAVGVMDLIGGEAQPETPYPPDPY